MKKYIIPVILSAITILAACQSNSRQKSKTSSADSTAKLEEVFADSSYQLTGVAATQDGRLFTNYPYWLDKHANSLVEIKSGKAYPYPNAEWNSFKKGENGQNKFVCVQAVVADEKGYLWVVDPAGIGLSKVYNKSNKVVKINLATNEVERIYRFPDSVASDESYINDIRIDYKHGYAYMTSSSNGGIVVFDINSGKSRFVLHGSPAVKSDTAYHFSFDGKEFTKADGSKPKINSDGIALSPDAAWLYFKPLTDNSLYRIKTSALRNFKLAQTALSDSVEALGKFTTTDGMEFDKKGNLYIGDLEKSSIIKITPDLKMHTLVTDTAKLVWPDSYSISDDGYLYISVSQIQRMPWFNNNTDTRKTPYTILRIKI